MSLPNPVVQAQLSSAIEEHWGRVRKHLARSKLTVSKPSIDFKGATAFAPVSLHEIYARKVTASGGYGFLLKTDVSRFYPTIYTHSIPWAVHSKSAAKKRENRNKFTPDWYGNILDRLVRAGQDQQTMGIPIGTDTSRILAELIAVSVDLDLKKRLGRWPAGFRYVDDYYLFFEEKSEAEHALAELSLSLREFELQLNFEKTKIVQVHRIADDSWTHQLRDVQFPSERFKQRSAINRYFDQALDLAESHDVESVMRYALRRIASTVIRKENWDYFESHLCRVALAYPNTLQDVAQLVATYSRYGYAIDRARIARVCEKSILKSAPLGHHGEVAWALWICVELQIKVGLSAVKVLGQLNSAICILLCLELERRGLLARKMNRHAFVPSATGDALRGEKWLLSYELARHGYAGCTDEHVKADPLFQSLHRRNVSFFDPARRLPPLFSIRKAAIAGLNLAKQNDLFDRVDALESFLDFEESVGEYHDAVETGRDASDFDDEDKL